MDSIAAALLLEAEESVCMHRCLRIERKILRDACNPFNLSNQAFIKNFRLNKEAFKYVLNVLEDELGPGRKTSISALSHLVAVIRFLSEGGYQHGVGKDQEVGMAQSTMSKSLKASLNILEEKLCPSWINISMTDVEKREAKYDFYRKANFPSVVLCVDGTHVKLIPPKEEPFLYYNRKGYYSINVMLLCDNKMRIRYVDAQYPGSNHDSHVWNLSDAKAFFEQKYNEGERNTYVLGDAGYPLQPWLITPFRSPEEGSRESEFNKRHSKTRMIIERTIGVLKNRFRCLLGARQLHYSPQKVVQIVNVSCALHNICIHFRVEDTALQIVERQEEIFDSEDAPSNYTHVASQIRENILRTILR